MQTKERIGVIHTVVTNTRQNTGIALNWALSRMLNTSSTGKYAIQMLTACFHRGGAACAGPNHGSMPLTLCTRLARTRSAPRSSHMRRGTELSQPARLAAPAKLLPIAYQAHHY